CVFPRGGIQRKGTPATFPSGGAHMSAAIDRRHFLAASTTVALGLTARAAEPDATSKVVVAVLGTGGRGTEHARTFAKQPGVEVAYVCDLDQGRANKAAEVVSAAGGKTPKTVTDFRRVLDDKAVDAVIIATCN